MRDFRNDNARGQAGEVGKRKTATPEFSVIDGAGVKPANDPGCTCHLVGAICFACHRWDRRIRSIEARRADSLRRQALGNVAAGG